MVLKKIGTALEWTEIPDPQPGPGEIRVKVAACGVCRTDLHVVDGELPDPKVPIIPGHEIVGRIDLLGADVKGLKIGERVGIPWLGHTCGVCPYCLEHRENLCDHPLFTGFTRNGGFATMVIADARFAFPLGETGSDVSLAPLLCAGLIGWRSLVIAGEGKKIGLYGFGAAAHIVAQVAKWQGRSVFAFTRTGDLSTQAFARSLGASWAGRFKRNAAGAARCSDYFCNRGGSCAACFEDGSQRWPRCLRRHPHERHPQLSVSITLGRAATGFGRESHATGRNRFFAIGAADEDRHENHDLSAESSQSSTCRSSRRSV